MFFTVRDGGIPAAVRQETSLCYCRPLEGLKVEQADITETSMLHNVVGFVFDVLEGLVVLAAVDQQILIFTDHLGVVVPSRHRLSAPADWDNANVGCIDVSQVGTGQDSRRVSVLIDQYVAAAHFDKFVARRQTSVSLALQTTKNVASEVNELVPELL